MSESIGSLATKARRRARRAAKHAWQKVGRVERARHRTLLILGCQRSGTTMLSEVFERDPAVRVFGELGELFSPETDNHRLLPLTEVADRLAHDPAGLVVVKPLVESQRTVELLDGLGDARAVWLYRHHRDVAASNLRRFGVDNGRRNIERLLAGDQTDWRSDRVSATTRSTVERLVDEVDGPHDAAALFWWCRNMLWFEQNLASEPRVMLCRYEDLVGDPVGVVGGIYDHLGMRRPSAAVTGAIHSDSVGKGDDTPLHPTIAALCEELLARLDDDLAARARATGS